jgi:hypothetical protein
MPTAESAPGVGDGGQLELGLEFGAELEPEVGLRASAPGARVRELAVGVLVLGAALAAGVLLRG